MQAQVNDMCMAMRIHERQISDLLTSNKKLSTELDQTLSATTEAMHKIDEFKRNNTDFHTLLESIQSKLEKFQRRATVQDRSMSRLEK